MRNSFLLVILSAFVFLSADCAEKSIAQTSPVEKVSQKDISKYSTAIFASGCFWCVEAVFESVEGVAEAVSGYAGGDANDANYKAVSAGITDHAEAVEVYYDPSVISYETLLMVFFDSHNATTLNRQGPDAGRQYRSAIFYKDETELAAAKKYISQLSYKDEVTTEIAPLVRFFPAEAYHQNYERNNPNQPYVRSVSVPRLKAFQAKHPALLKKKEH